jgi:hypothetical protein
MIERLKSPVVMIQLITIVGTLVVLMAPGTDQAIKEIVGAIAVIINVVAGLNNPTDPDHF